jgi:hypothetical protein
VQIRAAADQSAAEQTQRAITSRRVDELVGELERSLLAETSDESPSTERILEPSVS